VAEFGDDRLTTPDDEMKSKGFDNVGKGFGPNFDVTITFSASGRRMKLRAVDNFINIFRPAFAPVFFAKKLQSQTVTREKHSYKKGRCKMLMKLTPVDGKTKPCDMKFCC